MQIYFLQPSLIIFTKGADNSDQHCILRHMRIWRSVREMFGIWPDSKANLQKQLMSVAVATCRSRANANGPVTSF